MPSEPKKTTSSRSGSSRTREPLAAGNRISGIQEDFRQPAVYKDRREVYVRQYREEKEKKYLEAKEKARKSHAGKVFARILELVIIGLSFFERSYIVRFLTAKLSMDVLVEITAHFGPVVGHQVSSLLAAIVAEPRLVAVIVTGIILLLELLVGIFRMIFRPRRASR